MIELEEWVYVATNGLQLIGKYHDDDTLSPVLQLLTPIVPSSDGRGFGMSLTSLPFIGVGMPVLPIPEGSLMVPLVSFKGNERNWRQLIEGGLKIQETVRAQASGILVAPSRQ